MRLGTGFPGTDAGRKNVVELRRRELHKRHGSLGNNLVTSAASIVPHPRLDLAASGRIAPVPTAVLLSPADCYLRKKQRGCDLGQSATPLMLLEPTPAGFSFGNSVTLSCTLPSSAGTRSFAASQLTPGGAGAQTALNITTNIRAAVVPTGSVPGPDGAGFLYYTAIAVLVLATRRPRGIPNPAGACPRPDCSSPAWVRADCVLWRREFREPAPSASFPQRPPENRPPVATSKPASGCVRTRLFLSCRG
jgi:hypothetical protein